MSIYFIGQSAYNYCSAHKNLTESSVLNFQHERVSSRKEILLNAKKMGITGDISILIPAAYTHRRSKDIKFSTFSGNLPANSFYKITKDVYVATPEFVLLLSARHLNFYQIVRQCYIFCSKYYIFGDDLVDCKPLTTLSKIYKFLNECRDMRGSAKLKVALRYVQENAASPLEIKTAMMITLPMRYGGYGLGNLELNPMLDLSVDLQRLYKCRHISPDFMWRKDDVVVEYNSKEHHYTQEEKANDELKRLIYKDLDFKYVAIETSDAYSERKFHEKALLIAKYLGKRMRFKNSFGSKLAKLRAELDLPYSIDALKGL